MLRGLVLYITILFWLCTATDCTISREPPDGKEKAGIQISDVYPGYWAMDGRPVLLLGGSVEDNLFQIGHLEEHLDRLVSAGGNYVRNTMSSRDSGNLWAFRKAGNGLYDLDRWNPRYWERFERFLRLTAERDIVVQMEIWATFDFYRGNWDKNPFNPSNNINYDPGRSKLPEKVETHPVYTENNFFRSVPRQMALAVVLDYQRKFADRILSHTLAHDHVLYCMDNETSVCADWGIFWARYIAKKAGEAGKTVHATEMWDPWDLSHPFHSVTFDHPEIFTFVDISQNNHMTGQQHWDNGLKQMKRLEMTGVVRPVNNVKVYGNDGGRHKTTRNGIESFIQNVFMGCASTRFHRPSSGQGLNTLAVSVIRSMRELTGRMDFFGGEPRNDLLSERTEHEAYCRAIQGTEYAVYFPAGGEVILDISSLDRSATLIWLDVMKVKWSEARKIEKRDTVRLNAGGQDHMVALIRTGE